MKRGNKGYTLVEFLVVMSILSIVAVAGFSIIGYLTGTKAKSAAYNIQSGLGKARIETMSKSRGKYSKDIYFFVRYDENDENYYMGLKSKRDGEVKEMIGNSSINILGIYGSDIEVPLGSGEEIRFYFDRSTGGMIKEEDYSVVKTKDQDADGETPEENDQYEYHPYDAIKIVQGSVTYQIKIAPLTGKVSLERVF